ncbi:hypothetical protein BAUCODRAFT_148093 [Baudoinia panamericana UAMH 10762]|uniref:Transcription factor domain-containing protein n=1 Tax=Baudoinia panamericana (strain UAMH 10762) TaxID=717646 RepID=M2MIL1_BAUPA|nr:uncharacterized protein BAUCODRAFT_148093 [Baudoinia panamericana UAMH 10762]EMC96491.1 hypothetical protein BAUCODRAFT_148093 [Baudoinia panamericana UAMH 10762]
MKLRHCWFAFIPSHLGRHKAVDAAAEALSQAHRYYRTMRFDKSALEAALTSYARAVSLVQKCIESPTERYEDHTLLAIAILSHYETLIGNPRSTYLRHWSGVTALLLARSSSYPPSDLVRAMFYSMWDQLFRVPCAKGVASPYDNDLFLSIEPAAIDVIPDHVARLRRTGQQLLIRLPRLIADARRILNEPEIGDGTVIATMGTLADTYSKSNNSASEDKMLHDLRVARTERPVDRAITPFSFVFESSEVFSAAVFYWQTRLNLVNLCVYLMRSLPDLLWPTSDSANLSLTGLEIEQARLAADIVMSISHGRTKGDFGMVFLTQALLAVWSALSYKDGIWRGTVSVDRLRSWTLSCIYDSLGAQGRGKQAVRLVEAASQALMGGPLADWSGLMGL